ncbi:MAG: FHA domain-containing protein [Candidatus Limnocylindrales bacterium]
MDVDDTAQELEAGAGVKFLGRGGGARGGRLAAGSIVVVEGGRSVTVAVQPGQKIIVGRDPGANIVLNDPRVSPNHTLIERSGPGWLVSSLDAANPTWILDPTGRARPISVELGLQSGELLVGGCQLLLYPPS